MASKRKNKRVDSAGKKDTQAAVAGTGTGKKNQSESAVPVTPTQVSNSKKGPRNHSPLRRGPTGASLENALSPAKDNMQHTTSTTLINNSSVERRDSNSSSSSSNSTTEDEEESETEERDRRTKDKVRDNEKRGNEKEADTYEEIYNKVQGNMGANRNDKREGAQAFDVARDLVFSWMKFLDEKQYNSSDGIVASFISDQLNLFPEETPSMSNVVKENLRMGKHAWWFKVNIFVRDAINSSRAYACAKLRKGLRRVYFKNEGNNIPDLHDIMRGRENTDIEDIEALYIYFDVVVASQLKSVDWKGSNKYQLVSDLCTESDEAMGLLMLENSWDKWMEDFANEMKGEITTGDKRKQKGRDRHRTKYTIQGKMKGAKGSGWTEEGKVRFNQFFDKVEGDRMNFKQSEETFKKEMIRRSNPMSDKDEYDGTFTQDKSNKKVRVTITYKVPGSSRKLSNQKITGNSRNDGHFVAV
eukprot:scaffold84441_cov30-Attheya_sp.AAC.1